MRKKGVLQLALQLTFWVASDTCNSPYLYVMNVIRQVAKVTRIELTILWCNSYNSITTLLQQLIFNYYVTPHDYNHNVMLMSFFIHPSKFNTWHYEIFWWFFWNIDIHRPLWFFVLHGFGLWHVAQSEIATWYIN